MYEKKNETNIKSIVIACAVGLALALIMGLLFRPFVVAHAADPEDATLTDAQEKLKDIKAFTASLDVATSTDSTVDKNPYLTNKVTPLQTNDLLLSIRNILVCFWFTVVFIWVYDRMKAIIFRLSGRKKE